MNSKPKQWGQEYASIFQDASVVAAYQYRPPYPPELFDMLVSLIPNSLEERIVLDAGCGTGYIARPLAAYVDSIDAIDSSSEMIATGQSLSGGDTPNISWQAAPIETAVLRPQYGLIVAAASLHWMDWGVTLPRFAAHLAPGGVLATVNEWHQTNPWDKSIGSIAQRYSMNRDFSPYTMQTVLSELEQRQLFRMQGSYQTAWMDFQQPIEEWVEAFHARNGFSRDRMESSEADACDTALRAAIEPYCPDGLVKQQIAARVLWGTCLFGTG